MAIKLISVKCPDCKATLQVEDDRQTAFCPYCGARIIINNENEQIYRNIDEAKVMEAETERIIRLKELELEEKERTRERKSIMIAYGVASVFVLGGVLMMATFSSAYGGIGILTGLIIAEVAFDKSDRNKKSRRDIGTNQVFITMDMADYIDKDYNSVAAMYRGIGFLNITLVPHKDLGIFSQGKNGLVERVTIDGESMFGEGDVFPKDANVIITYHSR